MLRLLLYENSTRVNVPQLAQDASIGDLSFLHPDTTKGWVTSGLVKVGTVVDNVFSSWTASKSKVPLELGVIILIHRNNWALFWSGLG